MSKRKCPPNRCALCCGECVPCVDNFGANYMGCKTCVVIDPQKTEEAK
jgi:hypothetical protein